MEKALQAVVGLMAALSAAFMIYLFGNVASLLATYPKLTFLLLIVLELCVLISLIGLYRIWHWDRGGIMMVFSAWITALMIHIWYGSPLLFKAAVPLCLLALLATVLPNRERFIGSGDGNGSA